MVGTPYRTKPGFYLLAGPNWKSEVPAGITEVLKSPTAIANLIPRLFMDDTDEDRTVIQPVINQIVVYPLSEYDEKNKNQRPKKSPDHSQSEYWWR